MLFMQIEKENICVNNWNNNNEGLYVCGSCFEHSKLLLIRFK